MQFIRYACLLSMLLPVEACTASFPHDANLAAELAEQSRNEGLAIITTYPTSGTLPVDYFDGTHDQINCCGRSSQSWVVPGGRQLITLDNSNSVEFLKSLSAGAANLSYLTSNVVLFDLNGVEQHRFSSRITASFVAVSADGKMIAFRGRGGPAPSSGQLQQNGGLLFGPIDSTIFQKVPSVPEQDETGSDPNKRVGTIAWSADGSEITYGKNATIFVYSLRQRVSRAIAKGSNPLWSPDGRWISYRGLNGEAMLIDPLGRNARQLIAGQRISYALHWSPEGRYLLLTLLSKDGTLIWMNLAIYRFSDGAVTSIGEPGFGGDDYGNEWVVRPRPVRDGQ